MPRSDLSVVATHACGWPNLTKLSNGDLLCVYFNAPSHGQMEGDLVCSLKKSTSSRWQKLSVVSRRPPSGNRMHLAVGTANNGDILCFSSGFILENKKFVGFAGHWLSRSSDGGVSWKEDREPAIPQKLRNAIPYGRIVRVDDNTLAYSCYRSQGRGNPSESWVCFSEDDGNSWGRYYKLGKNDSNEVALCPLDGGKLLGATRTHIDHHVKICEFSATSKKWYEKGAVTLPMQHPADLIKIGSKALLLTYGLRNRGLMGLGVRISFDYGITWLPPCVIHQFGDQAQDIGYPSTIPLDDRGNMLTAYYTDFEPSFGHSASIYRVMVKRWNLLEWLNSDSRKLFLG